MLKEAPRRPLEEQLRLLALHIRSGRHGLLIVAVPDADAERTLAEETRRWLGDEASIEEVRLEPEPVERLSLSHHLSTLPPTSRPAAVFVFGLDDLPADARTTAINAMNWGRERLRQAGYTVVLWVRPGTPGELGNRAPDFFSWRSDVFQFVLPDDPTERERAIARLRLFAGTDLGELSRRYREYVIDTCRWLDFRGVLQVRNIVRLPLDDVFVSPDLTTVVEDVPIPVTPPAMGSADSEAGARVVRRVELWLPLDSALLQAQCLVILGDPGSGKSTALRFLALTYAQGRGRVKERLWIDEERLPVLVPLSAFAEARARGGELTIEAFLPTYFRAQGLPDLAGLFAGALAAGRVLVLLDGLDEMLDIQDRAEVARAIGDFMAAHSDVRVVVSSRIAGFQRGLLPAAFSAFTIAPLDDEGIKRFATQWTRAFEAAGLECPGVLCEDAARRAERRAESLVAAATGHPGVRQLAANPLMLTLLALVHQQGTRLPNRRADLYRLCVEALAETWNLARSLSGRPIDVRLGERRLDEDFVVRLLAPVAYWMHETQPTGMISAAELIAKIADDFMSQEDVEPQEAHRLARDFVSLAREQMGLLVERAPETFAFVHLTIQEYLAARFLSERRDSFDRIRARLHDPCWREVVRLTAGTLRGDYAAAFVERIISAHVPCEEIAQRVPACGSVQRVLGSYEVDQRRKDLVRTLLAFLDVKLGADCIAEGVVVPAALRRWTTVFVSERWLDETVARHHWQPTLVRLGRDVAGAEVKATLLDVLNDRSPDSWLRADAAQTLAEINSGREVARILLGILIAPEEDDWVRRWGVTGGLAEIARTDAELRNQLREILRDSARESNVRRAAAVALGEAGRLTDDDIQLLLRILADRQLGRDVRRGAAEALGRIGHAHSDAETALVSVARDRSEAQSLRAEAATAVCQLPNVRTATVSVLLEILGDRTEESTLRSTMLHGLRRGGIRDERLAEILFSIVHATEENPLLRGEAAELLAEMAPEDQEVRRVLFELVRDTASPAYARRGAVTGLCAIGGHDPSAVAVVLERLRDSSEDRWVRARAVNGCAGLWRTGRAIIPALLDCVDDPEVHDNVLSALLRILSEGGLSEIERVTGPIDGESPG